jgi:hypothetical protein
MDTTEPEPRHLHVHLGNLDSRVEHVHIHLGASESVEHVHIYFGASESSASSEVTVEPTVEASLKRLKDWNAANAENIRPHTTL